MKANKYSTPKYTYSPDGNVESCVWDNDPKHPHSFAITRDPSGGVLTWTYAQDPKHEDSCVYTYDASGRPLTCTYGQVANRNVQAQDNGS